MMEQQLRILYMSSQKPKPKLIPGPRQKSGAEWVDAQSMFSFFLGGGVLGCSCCCAGVVVMVLDVVGVIVTVVACVYSSVFASLSWCLCLSVVSLFICAFFPLFIIRFALCLFVPLQLLVLFLLFVLVCFSLFLCVAHVTLSRYFCVLFLFLFFLSVFVCFICFALFFAHLNCQGCIWTTLFSLIFWNQWKFSANDRTLS